MVLVMETQSSVLYVDPKLWLNTVNREDLTFHAESLFLNSSDEVYVVVSQFKVAQNWKVKQPIPLILHFSLAPEQISWLNVWPYIRSSFSSKPICPMTSKIHWQLPTSVIWVCHLCLCNSYGLLFLFFALDMLALEVVQICLASTLWPVQPGYPYQEPLLPLAQLSWSLKHTGYISKREEEKGGVLCACKRSHTKPAWLDSNILYILSEVGLGIRPILTHSAVPVTCKLIDCYCCTTRGFSLVCVSKSSERRFDPPACLSPPVQLL